jgi:iron(III) transport system substrate-binding protein
MDAMPKTSVRSARATRFVLAGLIALLALVAAAITYAPGSAHGAGGSPVTITLYNAQHEQTTDALVAAFTKKTGIKVRVENDDEDVLTAQIEQEGTRSPADVFYTENSNWLAQLDQRGLLAKLPAGTLASVPRRDSATDGGWVGVSARISVLVYNPSKVKASQMPTSVMGLADPRWKGKIEIAPSETDFWPIVDSVARTKGKAAALKWLEALKNNAGSAVVPDNETLVSDVNQGVTDLGLINHYYFFRLQAEVGKASIHAKIAYFAPRDPGYVEDISGAGVLKSSKHPAAAEAFVSFLTSKAGQEVLAHGDSFEYPIRPGVAADSELTPLAKLAPTAYTPAQLGSGLEAKDLLQAAGLI